jgi:hypothetical protein
MADKRYQGTQDAGESSCKWRANFCEDPMPPRDAAHVIRDVHTAPDGPRGLHGQLRHATQISPQVRAEAFLYVLRSPPSGRPRSPP